MYVHEILDGIDSGQIALPLFQRGYVWGPEDVKKFMRSLYRSYPVGNFLTWTASNMDAYIRTNDATRGPKTVHLLLDGQQRITTLYGIIRGEKPPFFDGDQKAFENLCFNLAGKDEEGEEQDGEEFAFYSPRKMRSKPLWIRLTDLFVRGPEEILNEIEQSGAYSTRQMLRYMERARKIYDLRNEEFDIKGIKEENSQVSEVIEIFNAINSGGRGLTDGDLVLARIGGMWPDARRDLQNRLSQWGDKGFKPLRPREWLLRCMTVVATGEGDFKKLDGKSVEEIKSALDIATKAIDRLLEVTHDHLGMDESVHKSPNAFVVMVKYLVDNDGDFPNDASKAGLLHWYINVSMWRRFSGSTESLIASDLRALKKVDPIAALWREFLRAGNREDVRPEDFDFQNRSASFYTLFHIMSFAAGARDWGGNGDEIGMYGANTELELHHIFPKSVLSAIKVPDKEINGYGNRALLARETNRAFGDTPPSDYLPQVAKSYPRALESQWVPNNSELWKVGKYQEFLTERRQLLAEAANGFLASLYAGNLPPAVSSGRMSEEQGKEDEEQDVLIRLNKFLDDHKLPAGELDYEILDKGKLVAKLDLAWPKGLKDGLSEPVAVLIGEADTVRSVANNAGFRLIFTTEEDFMLYVRREILGEEDEAETEAA